MNLTLNLLVLSFLQAIPRYLQQFAFSLGGPGLFLVALCDSSFLSIPEGNDILIVVLSTGQTWSTMSYYVAMTIAGSVSGCSLLYAVGRRGGSFIERRVKKEKLDQIEDIYRRWGLWSILIPAILPPPTPFKIFVLAAGIFQIPFRRFFLAVAVGRSVRYFMWGILAVLYGDLARQFIEENMQLVGTVLAGLFAAALIGYLIFWLRARRRQPQQEAI